MVLNKSNLVARKYCLSKTGKAGKQWDSVVEKVEKEISVVEKVEKVEKEVSGTVWISFFEKAMVTERATKYKRKWNYKTK